MENILNQPLETIFKDEPDILEHFQDYFNNLKKVGINTIEDYINKIIKESKSSNRRK